MTDLDDFSGTTPDAPGSAQDEPEPAPAPPATDTPPEPAERTQSPQAWASTKGTAAWVLRSAAHLRRWPLDPNVRPALVTEVAFDAACAEVLSARLG